MYIKSIHLEDVKAFKRLDFSLERPNGEFGGWTVFVGGNASGKSTLLKSIAAALMGPDAGRQLLGSTAGWIRQDEKRATASLQLIVDTHFDSFKRTGRTATQFLAGVRWQRSKDEEMPEFKAIDQRKRVTGTRIQIAERGPWDPNSEGWFSVGYGPMRRLSGSSSESIRYAVGGGVVSRFVTLFREDAALSESEEWLRKTHSRTLESADPKWLSLLNGVKALLGDGLLPHGMKISRITVDHVFVIDERGVELPMRDISDGCRGVYAMVLDLIHGMFEVYDDAGLVDTKGQFPVVNHPGVVLIDEIEAHLHPAWQRDIPNWFKKHFPKLQFLVSTHSPLVAQAADPNGIFLLPLQDEMDREPRALTEQEYERVRWGSAHKTVLGVAFGLKSTRSQWANQQIRTWQRLESKRRSGSPLSPDENAEHLRLKTQIRMAFDSDLESFPGESDAPAAIATEAS